MGWQPAKSDGTAGGNALTDVYLANIGPAGLFGYAAVDPNQRGTSRFAYLVMDNDYTERAIRGPRLHELPRSAQVTAAHEYNHVLQYNYDTFADSWMFEASATWMEDKVYDDINDYRFYLPSSPSAPTQPLTQFNSPESGDTNDKVYADAVFNRWIDERYGSDPIRRIWEVSVEEKEFVVIQDSYPLEDGSGWFAAASRTGTFTQSWALKTWAVCASVS